MFNDEYWMQLAIKEAQTAQASDEVPVGAVILKNNELIGKGYNQVITLNDCTAHAEIQAIRQASAVLNNYRLPETTLYVTLEPCMMCLGSLIHARVQRLVFGAFDPKTGVVSSQAKLAEQPFHNHKLEICGGVLEQECGQLLKDFFKLKRLKNTKLKQES